MQSLARTDTKATYYQFGIRVFSVHTGGLMKEVAHEKCALASRIPHATNSSSSSKIPMGWKVAFQGAFDQAAIGMARRIRWPLALREFRALRNRWLFRAGTARD